MFFLTEFIDICIINVPWSFFALHLLPMLRNSIAESRLWTLGSAFI